jgi:small-conductance mechanosensitive channel
MNTILRSVLKVWLVLFLALAGAGAACAQTPADNDQQTGQAAPVQQDAPKPDAKSAAVVAAALPGGILEAAGKAERTAADISQTVDQLKQKLATPSLPQAELAKARVDLEAVRERAKLADAELTGPLSQLDQLVARLGAPPKEGETEPEAVAAQRALLDGVRGKLLGARAQLGLATGAADQLATQAGQIERDRFRDNLLSRGKSVLQPVLWTDGFATVPDLWSRTIVLFKGFHTRIEEDNPPWTSWFLIAAFFVLLAAGYKACRVLAHKVRSEQVNPGELGKLIRVVAVPIGYAVIATAAIAIFGLLYKTASPDSPRLDRLYAAFGFAMIGFAFARGVARSVLSPTRSGWRIANLSDSAAGTWLNLSTVAFLFIGGHHVVSELSNVINMTDDLLAVRQAVLAIVLAVIITRLILSVGTDRREGEKAVPAPQYFAWASYTIQPVWLVLIASVAALLAGYMTLSVYLVSNIVIIGVVVSFLYCVRQMADAFVAQSVLPGSRIARTLKTAFSMSERSIQHAGIALNAGVDLTLLLLGLPLLLALSALTWVDVRSWISTAFFGFKVGDITISLSAILLALAVFAVGLVITRFVTSWLDRRILAPTDMDTGVRNSIRTGASYTAIILALLVAFAAAGVDFGNIAIVAGALSLGIGFGLQSIVNNFVSGLILLAERPIKVGDWVQVAGGEGTVRKINVRSTQIETFDRCSIIVPNSSLISDSVQNWTHGDLMGRCKVAVGVSYDADPQQVHNILMKCAEEHPRAMAYPQPTVLFKDFGASSLDFEVRVFIDDVNWVAFVGSELRFAIHKELKAAGIEIPFPQRDVNVRGLKEAIREAGEE